jgi:methylglyoxal reductase
MKVNKLGSSDLNVSEIGLGSWIFGRDYWQNVVDEDSLSVIDAALSKGINFIDTAPFYGDGHSETIVGKGIASVSRDSVIIATKCGLLKRGTDIVHDLSSISIEQELDQSLKRLQTDYVDLYQLHWPDPQVSIEKTMETLQGLKEQGLIRHIGLSNHPLGLVERAIKVGPVVSLQDQYSLLTLKNEQSLLPYALSQNMGVIGYGPLHGGLLTGKYRHKPHEPKNSAKNMFYQSNNQEQWTSAKTILEGLRSKAKQNGTTIANEAIRGVLDKGITTAIIGARNVTQLKGNLGSI